MSKRILVVEDRSRVRRERGKSHLCEFFLEHVVEESHATLRYQCSPHHPNSPFYPVISQLEQAMGFEQADTPDLKFDKLRAALSHTFEPCQVQIIAGKLQRPLFPCLSSGWGTVYFSSRMRDHDRQQALPDRHFLIIIALPCWLANMWLLSLGLVATRSARSAPQLPSE